MRRIFEVILSMLLLASSAFAATSSPGPENILIVYNANTTADDDNDGVQDSLEVANYYALKRGVPPENILGLNCSTEYGYNDLGTAQVEVIQPIIDKLNDLGPYNIDIILMCYRTPYAYYGNGVSLDNILMGLNSPSSGGFMVNNPYLYANPIFAVDPGHFDHDKFKFEGSPMYLVCRIDGPLSVLGSLNLVDQALYADHFIGEAPGYYNGNVYVNSQGEEGPETDANLSTNPDVISGNYSGYASGDANMAYGEHYVLGAGLTLKWQNTGSLSGTDGAFYTDGSSATTAPQALMYGGWYAYNTYILDTWEWLPGSVASDLDSCSLSDDIRNPNNSVWGVSALSYGASCVCGVFTEPYMNGNPRPNILLWGMLNGYTFAEAAGKATPYIGWQELNIGDPLMAPFKAKTAALDTAAPAIVAGYPYVTWTNSAGHMVHLLLDDSAGPKVAKVTIDYGVSTAYGQRTVSTGFFRHFAMPLCNLPAGTIMHYRITAVDPAGNTSVSGDYTFTSAAGGPYGGAAQVIPGTVTCMNFDEGGEGIAYHTSIPYYPGNPRGETGVYINNSQVCYECADSWLDYTVNVSESGLYSADVLYTTNDGYGGKIFHLECDGVNVSGPFVINDTNPQAQLLAKHHVPLPAGLHTLRLALDHQSGPKHENGHVDTFGFFNYILFTCENGEATFPQLSAIAVNNITATNATATWTTDVSSTSAVDYGPTTAYGFSAFSADLGTSHSVVLCSLWGGGTFHYRVRSADIFGNETVSGDNTFATPGGSSTITLSSISSNTPAFYGTTISWTTSASIYNALVQYGQTANYGSQAYQYYMWGTTSPSIIINGLSPNTTYHYCVQSWDNDGNLASSGDNTFTTASGTLSNPPTISAVTADSITNNAARITWSTDEASDTTVYWGLTTNYGYSSDLLNNIYTYPGGVTSHFCHLYSLDPDTLYHYCVVSNDVSGNQSVGQDYTFTTTGNNLWTLSIATTSPLPGATVGIALYQAFAAQGGMQPYTWSVIDGATPAGLTFSKGELSGTPTQTGPNTFTVQVADFNGVTATQEFSLAIYSAGSQPAITTVSLPAGTVGAEYSQTLSATGGTGSYTWSVISGNVPLGLNLSGAGVLSGVPSVPETCNFTVQAADQAGLVATQALSLSSNSAALSIATVSPLHGGQAGLLYTQTFYATGGAPPYSWTIISGTLPSGLTLSPAGLLSGIPTGSGPSAFTVQVADNANANVSQSFSVTINGLAMPTIITTSPLPDGIVNTPYNNLTFFAAGGTPPYIWTTPESYALPPTGMTLSSSGVLSGTPTATGTTSIIVQAEDSANNIINSSFSLTIDPAILTITTTSLGTSYFGGPGSGWIGYAFSETLTAAGGTPPYSWSLVQGTLPPGLTLSAGGLFGGIPVAAGTYTFTIQVADSANATASLQYSLSIYPAGFALTTVSPLPAGTEGAQYSQTITTTGGTSPYTWSISQGSLPAGLTLNSGLGVVSGTPTVYGTFFFEAQVADSESNPVTLSRVYVLTINPAALMITSASVSNGMFGTPYLYVLTALGGAPPYSWTVSAGTLPPGLSLSNQGILSGTPSALGQSNFTVQGTDSANATAPQTFALTVNTPLQITSLSLPNGVIGSPYSQTLAAIGGAGNYTWTISSGALPANFALSDAGALMGVPSAPGKSNFIVQVADSANTTISQALALTINSTGYTVSGTITLNGNGLAGVTISCSAGSATTDISGNYSIAGVANGSYTLTPTLAGYTFNPTTLSPTVSGTNLQNENFTATANTYSISGTITLSGGGNLQGVTVTLTSGGNTVGSATTGSNGQYSIADVANGSYTLTPSLVGYTFSPTTLSATVNGANLPNQNFTATQNPYTISGTITVGGQGLSGVTVNYGGNNSVTTNSTGAYTISGMANGSYTLTPSLSGYTFSPTNQVVQVSGGNATQNFTATGAYSISGTISIAGGGELSWVAINYGGSNSVTTDRNGNYTISGLTNGNYTLTPSLSGWTFNPSNPSVQVSGENATQNFVAYGPGTETFSISGTVTLNGGGTLQGVTVTLTSGGNTVGSATTGSNGQYSINGLTNGAYTLTPSLAGYTFNPTNQAITISDLNTTQNFTATGAYSISGTVTLKSVGLSGVVVNYGGNNTVTTGSNGSYAISGLINGSYTLTPSLAGYTFNPSSPTVQVSGASQTQNFAATAVPGAYSINGTVTLNGAGLSGVTVSCSSGSATTNSSGVYSISNVANGLYTLTPSLVGYTFSPTTLSATVNNANLQNQNFTATQNTYTISGTITMGGQGLSGVTVSCSAGSATTNISGAYTINGAVNGSYTLTPSFSNYIFAPTTLSATVNGANVTGLNFVSFGPPDYQTYSISGTITMNGNGLSGVTVSCSAGSATTNASGAYTISGVVNGSYTLTPSLSGYDFSPTSQVVQVNGGNATQNFTQVDVDHFFAIYGTITCDGKPLAGVTVTCDFGGATTNSLGYYLIPQVVGSVALTPSLDGYTFNPANPTVTYNNEPSTMQNFTATINPPTFVATPAFSPAPGAYDSTQTVTISCANSWATIYYTTDCSTPTALSTQYSTPISFSASTQLQAIAIEAGTKSLVCSGVYNIAGSSTFVPDTYNDTDGNGYPDEVKTALGVSLTNPNATPLNMQSGITPQALTLSKLSVKLNFAKTTGNDEIMVNGSLPIMAGFAAKGQPVVVDVGGVVKIFTLSSKGDGTGATGYPAVTSTKNDHFDLKFKSLKGKVATQTGTFTAQFNKGTFASSFTDVGLTRNANVKKVARTIPVTILFNNQMYQTAQAVQYSATAQKTGLASFASQSAAKHTRSE
jgi:uncharacterized protein (TIGR03790 family)